MKNIVSAATLGFACLNAMAGIPVSEGRGSNPVPAATSTVAQMTEMEKATSVSREFIKLMYDVPAKEIKARANAVNESAAVVDIGFLARQCQLRLVKNPHANEHGWVVQKHNCSK